MNVIPAIYVPIALGLFVLVNWIASEKYPRLRMSIRTHYQATYAPFFIRTGAATAPPWAIAIMLVGVAAAMPRDFVFVVVLAAIDVASLAFALGYRYPHPLMPKWLRQEIAEGLVEPARPERSDWILLWFWLGLAGSVSVAAPIYLVVFHGGSS